MSKILDFPASEEAVLNYLRSLDRTEEKKIIDKIVYPNIYGTRINMDELEAVFNRLGYDGSAEVLRITPAFTGRLVAIYRELLKDIT